VRVGNPGQARIGLGLARAARDEGVELRAQVPQVAQRTRTLRALEQAVRVDGQQVVQRRDELGAGALQRRAQGGRQRGVAARQPAQRGRPQRIAPGHDVRRADVRARRGRLAVDEVSEEGVAHAWISTRGGRNMS